MKLIPAYLITIAVVFTFTACTKHSNPPPASPCFSLPNLEYQWQNTYILEQTYSGSTSNIVGQTVVAYPGYFQLNADYSYNVLSNGVSDNGTWDIEQTGCLLQLDKGTSNARAFSVVTLNSDSLIIKRTDSVNHVIYTQHYSKPVSGSCVTLTSLEYQWQNTFILEQTYSGSSTNITSNNTVNNTGYFQLNANATYNISSNGVPTNGSWDIEQPGCLLELDKGTSNDRAFKILTLTSDSLVIKRTDSLNMVIYTQHYSK